MKKVIKASTSTYEMADRRARKILTAAKALLDVMDESPDRFIESNDLAPLYEELIDTIPALSMMIENDGLEY